VKKHEEHLKTATGCNCGRHLLLGCFSDQYFLFGIQTKVDSHCNLVGGAFRLSGQNILGRYLSCQVKIFLGGQSRLSCPYPNLFPDLPQYLPVVPPFSYLFIAQSFNPLLFAFPFRQFKYNFDFEQH
jgi:hypothetical protein